MKGAIQTFKRKMGEKGVFFVVFVAIIGAVAVLSVPMLFRLFM